MSFAAFAKADTIVAFGGSFCDGDVGNTVQCDGSCHQFGGRYSNSLQVIFCFFLKNNNKGDSILTRGILFTTVNSFLCAPTDFCLV